MHKKDHQQWLQDKPIIAKGIAVAIDQVDKGTLSMKDMAYGIVSSLLEYTTQDEWYSRVFDLVSRIETIEDGQENLVESDYKQLKDLVRDVSKI